MKFLSGEEVKNFLQGLVYEKKQVHKHCVDLTVQKIYRLEGRGELDFGGSEYRTAEKKLIKPKKRDGGDRYGWWELKPGCYIFKFNELLTLAEGQKAVIQMHSRLMESGGCHFTLFTEDSGEIRVPVIVSGKVSVKENARVSEVRILEG